MHSFLFALFVCILTVTNRYTPAYKRAPGEAPGVTQRMRNCFKYVYIHARTRARTQTHTLTHSLTHRQVVLGALGLKKHKRNAECTADELRQRYVPLRLCVPACFIHLVAQKRKLSNQAAEAYR
jgi:hypothetical protein